jgi:hypothetical protein
MAVIAAALAMTLASGALSVSPPASVRGDGRTTAPVELTGGPDPLEGEDARLPDLGTISCAGAAVVAGREGAAPRVLAPATAAPTELSCLARRRGDESMFSLHVEPPGPGLYAAALRLEQPGQLAFKPFRIQPDGISAAPRSLHAAVSAGQLREAADGLRVVLPPGRAPRAFAIVLLDGDGEGAAFLPLPGQTQLYLQSKRRALLSVRVAGAPFGPVRAPEGKATVSVAVPPGTREGVVRAVDRLGNARELPIDLATPSLPRLAAAASASHVVAGGEVRVAVALAAPDGAPAEGAAVRASAGRGSLEAPSARGPGLWVVRYRAPGVPGSDRIALDVEDDPSAGGMELAVEVVPGPPARISLDLSASPVRAGDELAVRADVRDSSGNALSGVPLEAWLAGAPARVLWEGATASLSGTVPQQVSRDSSFELSVRSGDAARAVARIELRPAEAYSAELIADSAERTARLRALVRDRFGNALGVSGFTLSADGGTLGPPRAGASGMAEANLEAAPRARAADAWVTAGGRVLARTHIAFDPPPDAWLLFARAEGGAMSNGGALRAPRFGAGIGVRRHFGPIEAAAIVGLDALSYRDRIAADLAGAEQDISRRLFALAVPLLLRARLPFASRWGAAVEAGPVPTFAWTSASSGASGTERVVTLRPGLRTSALLDFSLGRGRLELGVSLGTSRLVSGPLRGEIEGRSIFIGYEAWWLDLGP